MMMRLYHTTRSFLVGGFLLLVAPLGSAQEAALGEDAKTGADPAARWVTVYGWIQTGDRLAGAGQWALAMGSYIESHRQIRELAEIYPAYETELVTYRTEKLEEVIATTDAQLSEDEHETTMKYLDFIESLELGLEQRFSNKYEVALENFDIARSLLDELIGKKPPEFRAAIDSQYRRVEDNILWLSSQIVYKEDSRSRPPAVVDDGRDRGTTKFIKKEDLPDSSEGVFASGMLFPSSLSVNELTGVSVIDLVPLPGSKGPEKPKPTFEAGSPRRYRMNSREKLDDIGVKPINSSR